MQQGCRLLTFAKLARRVRAVVLLVLCDQVHSSGAKRVVLVIWLWVCKCNSSFHKSVGFIAQFCLKKEMRKGFFSQWKTFSAIRCSSGKTGGAAAVAVASSLISLAAVWLAVASSSSSSSCVVFKDSSQQPFLVYSSNWKIAISTLRAAGIAADWSFSRWMLRVKSQQQSCIARFV